MRFTNKTAKGKTASNHRNGFTIVEVIVAASIMIVLCVGTLSVFSYVVKLNRGENLRAQALSVLQAEVEYYRSLKFIPGAQTAADLNNHRDTYLRVGTHTRPPRASADGRVFNITVTVVNVSPSSVEELCRYKEIRIVAVPQVAENGWLANLRADVTIQRVRSN